MDRNDKIYIAGHRGMVGSAILRRLKKEGFEFISDKPKPGADNKLICFINPKNASGILIELCQHNPTDIGISPQKIENIS